MGYSPRGHKKLDTAECTHTHTRVCVRTHTPLGTSLYSPTFALTVQNGTSNDKQAMGLGQRWSPLVGVGVRKPLLPGLSQLWLVFTSE